MEYILYLHRVFHGIKFKVNKKDWLSEKIKYTPYTH